MADWLQFGIVLLVVATATGYLARRMIAVLRVRQAADCGGGCSGCPKSVARDPSCDVRPALIQLDGFGETNRGRA